MAEELPRPDLAPTRETFAAGRLGPGQAGVVVRTMTQLDRVQAIDGTTWAEAQHLLVAAGEELDSRQLGRAAAKVTARLCPEGAERLAQDEDAMERLRSAYLVQESTGMWVMRAVLPPTAGATLRAALDPLCQPRPSGDLGPDPRTGMQRMADGLVALAELSLAQRPDDRGSLPRRHGASARLVVTGDVATLLANATQAGGLVSVAPAVVETGEPGGWEVSPLTFQTLSCDAEIVPMLLDGLGRPLDVGDSHYRFPRRIRLAIEVRDRHCTFEGCSARRARVTPITSCRSVEMAGRAARPVRRTARCCAGDITASSTGRAGSAGSWAGMSCGDLHARTRHRSIAPRIPSTSIMSCGSSPCAGFGATPISATPARSGRGHRATGQRWVGGNQTAWWTDEVRFGVHLPLMDLGGQRFAVDHLVNYVETATALGFEAISANDHVVFGAPWLDGPTALAAVVACSGSARLFTTVANPVVRGPAALAKVLAGLDVLSGGRVVAALGPGSSERDYASAGVPFEERWPRFDEAVSATRALLRGESFGGRFYAVDGPLEPLPAQPNGPPLWVGSWGSEVGLRRAVRLGDGWLASAYNIAPEEFRERWDRVRELLGEAGRDPAGFANGLATMWFHIDDARADGVLEKRLAPAVHRPIEQLRERLAFGSAEAVLEKVTAFRDAGAQWMFLWPVADDIEQLHRFSDGVIAPLQA